MTSTTTSAPKQGMTPPLSEDLTDAVQASSLTKPTGIGALSQDFRGKSVHFSPRRSLSARVSDLTADPAEQKRKTQDQAVNSAHASLHMVCSRLEEMRVIAIRAQDDELSEAVRTKLNSRFEQLKKEVSALSQEFNGLLATATGLRMN